MGFTKADRKNWARAAILSLLLHTMLFAIHTGMSGAQSGVFGNASVVCSAGQARLNDDGKGDHPTSTITVKCLLCSLAGLSYTAPDTIGAVFDGMPVSRSGACLVDGFPRLQPAASYPPARGPPLHA